MPHPSVEHLRVCEGIASEEILARPLAEPFAKRTSASGNHVCGIQGNTDTIQTQLKVIDEKLEKLVCQVTDFQTAHRISSAHAREKMVQYEPKLLDFASSPGCVSSDLVGIQDLNIAVSSGDGRLISGNGCESSGQAKGRHSRSSHFRNNRSNSSNIAKRVSEQTPTGDFWERIVEDSRFDGLCAFVVLLYSLLVGVQINHDATYDHEENVYNVIEYVCTGYFTVELFLRILARKRNFFAKKERAWAIFDVGLVGMSWLDIGMELIFQASGGMPGPGASIGKMLKMARMARIMRILRMMRWLTRIRIMVTLIVGSMTSLFWLMVLLLTVMYIFAIVLTQGATMWLKPGEGYERPVSDANYGSVQFYYGSVFKSIYTLFMSMTGGVSWGEPGDVTQSYGLAYFFVFIGYIFFAIFSVMNIVTGVFVDGAIQQAESDRSMMLEKAKEQKLEMARALEEILGHLDRDNNGVLTRLEWGGIFADPNIHGTLASMQIEIDEAEDLYDLLDIDGDGEVSIKEFIDGMIRLKGWARAIEIERLNARVARVVRVTEKMYEQVGHIARSTSVFQNAGRYKLVSSNDFS